MPLSDIETRLVADGLHNHPDVKHLVRIARLAYKTRNAQRDYFAGRNSRERGVLLSDSKMAERELDAALADTPKQEVLEL